MVGQKKQVPIVKPAPIVEKHAEVFQDLFENQKQYQHLHFAKKKKVKELPERGEKVVKCESYEGQERDNRDNKPGNRKWASNKTLLREDEVSRNNKWSSEK